MAVNPAAFNDITGSILNAAIEVHRNIGPGLLESAYIQPLLIELKARNLRLSTQRRVPLVYKGVPLDVVYRVDLIVDEVVIVEIKSVATMLPVYQAQLLTYLRLARCPVGLLINFNVSKLVDGVKRVLNPSHE
jgi:GxxExxY protein